MNVCHACTNDIQDESVFCHGFCNAVFHPKCCHLPSVLLDEIIRNRQLFWMCKSCANIMSDVRHRKNIKAAYDAGLEKQLSDHTELLANLKKEILEDLKSEIRTNFTKLSNTVSVTSRPGVSITYQGLLEVGVYLQKKMIIFLH